mgnify:CR=1 FL=1
MGEGRACCGAAGNKDKTKRPLMGNVATEYADYTIFTSEDPRLEDPNDIIKEMTKSEIVKEISARTGIDGKAVLAVVEGFMNEVKTSLGKEENVYLRGFGSFIVKKRAQKTARNISKNTTMIIPAHNIPAFKPSDEFLKMVKQQNA